MIAVYIPMQTVHKQEKKKTIYFYDEFTSKTMNLSKIRKYARQRQDFHLNFENNRKSIAVLPPLSWDEDVACFFSLLLVSSVSYKRIRLFCKHETALFEYKISSCDHTEILEYFYKDFIPRIKNIEIQQQGEIKITKIMPSAVYCPQTYHKTNFRHNEFLIHFKFLADALTTHELKVSCGFVELRTKLIKTLILNMFRKFIYAQALQTHLKYKNDPDERIAQIYSDMFHSQPKNTGAELKITTDELFLPPCISGIMAKMRTENHLKFRDRLVLARFFKDAGMPVDECIQLFRANFKKISNEDMKEHAYMIRHSYGLEGGRKNYKAYDCSQMISHCKENDAYGCPFKKDPVFVRKYLATHGKTEGIQDIEALMAKNELQKACSLTIKTITDKNDQDYKPVTSPIEYFSMVKISKADKKQE